MDTGNRTRRRLSGRLAESGHIRRGSAGGTTLSTLLHTMLIGGAVAGTTYTPETLRYAPIDTASIVWMQPPAPQTPSPPAPSRQLIATNLAPVHGARRVIVDLSVVPVGLPDTDTRIGTILEEAIRSVPRDSLPTGPAREPTSGTAIMTEAMVERPVQGLPGNVTPRYPTILQSAGVEGTVYAQFVVDTTGRVERGTIRFVSTSHALFEQAVREALGRARYAPAEVGRTRVRQLVEQSFSFAIRR